ncbi:MAG TPA: hypothetical protein VGJ70_07970 [Solirubrobacteraceae bacterium]|jgi:hypothetical protein
MPDLHLRVLRQAAGLRRRQRQAVRDAEPSEEAGEDRLRNAEDVQARADAQVAAAKARRNLDAARRL